jgi:crossover junction endodeoxyribonuclease RuvC
MNYIGIDPGKKGGFAVIADDIVIALPWDDKKFITEMERIRRDPCIVCLEKVGAMPKQSPKAMFTFGESFGFIQGVLTALGIPFDLVPPKRWQNEFLISGKKGPIKEQSIKVCQRLFPSISLLPTERSRVPSDGMAEALLMAEYARRKL